MIAPLDRTLEAAAQRRLDSLAKPPGALGRIEDLAIRLSLIQQSLPPRVERLSLLIFAGDHGMNDEGVSTYPSSVTGAMVATFAAGKASANAFARVVGAQVKIIDAGVSGPASPAGVINARIRAGTRNAAREPALTADEAQAALDQGAAIAAAEIADVIAIGEMGIGNTSSAALIMHRLAPAPLSECIGVGTGHNSEGLQRKRAVLDMAAQRSAATEPLEVLRQFGGLEIVMMAGAVLGAARTGRPVLVDGFIASSAALAAIRLEPNAADYCIFAHRSGEAGHQRMLETLGAEPLLDLGLRLGEGTGALLAWPLLRAACSLLSEVATLEDVLEGRL